MCNPRRIRVRASAHLAEAWDQEVRRQVTLHGSAVGRAAIRESLAATLGAPVLSALDRVLESLDGWESYEDGYRHVLEGGYVHYHVDRGELEIVAEQAADVYAQGEAEDTIQGFLEADLEVEGEGCYYDDGWGGRTESTAQRDATVDADRRLARERQERLAQARAELEAGTAGAVEARAQEAARAALTEAAAARSAELDQQAMRQLAAVGVQGRAVFQQGLALAYRDAILSYARRRNAQGLRVSGGDGVLDIEFELEI